MIHYANNTVLDKHDTTSIMSIEILVYSLIKFNHSGLIITIANNINGKPKILSIAITTPKFCITTPLMNLISQAQLQVLPRLINQKQSINT